MIYTVREGVTDTELRRTITGVRGALTSFRRLWRGLHAFPEMRESCEHMTTEAMEAYTALLTEARARRLAVPRWEGDRWHWNGERWEREEVPV